MRKTIILLCLVVSVAFANAQNRIDSLMPIRGLAIAAPSVGNVDKFIKFIDEELSPAHFNTLVLRIDYNFAYTSHPELRNANPLTQSDINKIKNICTKHKIDIIPQVNLLGHQSWHFATENLLRVYPQFDETPHVKMDAARAGQKYEYPNADGLYCKSRLPESYDK